MKQDTKTTAGFQLRIRPHPSHIYSLLFLSLVLVAIFSTLLYQRVNYFSFSLTRAIGVLVLFVLSAASLGFCYYFYRITTLKGSAIVFGTKEWRDSISPFFLGQRSVKEIQQAGIKKVMGIECLELQLKENVLGEFNRRPLFKLYLSLFGHRIFVPLTLLDISRLDLESQFLHLENIISKNKSKSGFERNFQSGEPVTRIGQSPAPANNRSIFSHIQGESEKPSQPESLNPIIAEVSRRKLDFQQKGLDKLICDIFIDFARELPDRTREESKRIPEGAHLIRHRTEGTEYEEIEFSWKGQAFQMGLRTNLEEGTEALLSLAIASEVKVSLKVGVEIGTLEPRELERYIAGDWEQRLKDLEKALKKPKSERNDTSAKSSQGPKLEDLKKNFGLKDE